MKAKGLTVSDNLKNKGPMLMMIWIQFNEANELINCIHAVQVPKTCGKLAKPTNPFVK